MTTLLEPLDENAGREAKEESVGLGADSEKKKKTILVLIGSYLPGFKVGGPIQSIAALVETLNDEYDFKIICGDRDLGDREPFENEPVGRWYMYGSAKVFRIPRGARGAWMLIRVLRLDSFDILYISGVLSRTYSMLPLFCRRISLLPKRPLVLAPRGELSSGALGLKPRRKRIYLALAKWIGLFDGILWQASSEWEKKDIIKEFGSAIVKEAAAIIKHDAVPDTANDRSNKVMVARDLFIQVDERPAHDDVLSKTPGKLRVVTMGRVCPMKNIDFAISIVKQLRGSVTYDIYGPLEDSEYVARCKRHCANLPDGVTVRLLGAIPHQSVPAILSKYHVFLLPTLGENFGHAISEAMQAGCVPLISDRTPWQHLKDAHAGWSLSLSTPEAFTDALRTALTWMGDEFLQLSRNAREYAANHTLAQDGVRDNRSLFAAAAALRDRPW